MCRIMALWIRGVKNVRVTADGDATPRRDRALDGGGARGYTARLPARAARAAENGHGTERRTMSRRCQLTGTGALRGMHVSHAHNRTPRHFQPNLQTCSLYSDALGGKVRLRLAAATLRSVEHRGGLDGFLAGARAHELTAFGRRLKARIREGFTVVVK